MSLSKWVENIIHALRYRKVAPHLKQCETWVDLGCGVDWRLIKKYAHLARSVWGLDKNIKNHAVENIILKKHDITQPLPIDTESVDQITLLAVLEHIKKPAQLLVECYRLLRPGGRLLVTTPSQRGIIVHEGLRRLRLVQDVEEGEHIDFAMSKKILKEWVETAGFQCQVSVSFEMGMNIFVVGLKK